MGFFFQKAEKRMCNASVCVCFVEIVEFQAMFVLRKKKKKFKSIFDLGFICSPVFRIFALSTVMLHVN